MRLFGTPLGWIMWLIYAVVRNYGIALILFTVLVKIAIFPLSIKQQKSTAKMAVFQPKINEIQQKYANNKQKQQEEMMKLYEAHGYNPMSGCLWSFLPLPILLALYSILRQPVTHLMMLSNEVVQELVDKVTAAGMDMSAIVQMKDGAAVVKDGVIQMMPYGQINLVKAVTEHYPEAAAGIDGWIDLNYNFLGLDLAATPSTVFSGFHFSWAVIGLILIPILAGAFQLFMSMYMMKSQPQQQGAGSMKGMMYMMPLMSVYIGFIMPAALGVYWIAQSVFSLIQEVIMTKFFNKKLEAEENARYEAIQADRQRRQEEAKRLQEERKQQAAQKQTLKQKQKAAQEAKAAKAAKAGKSTTEAGRVGDRPYARGRSYKADRYDD